MVIISAFFLRSLPHLTQQLPSSFMLPEEGSG